MADNNVEQPEMKPKNPGTNITELGKPAARWKTFLTKTDAVAKYAFSGASLALGTVMVVGSKSVGEAIERMSPESPAAQLVTKIIRASGVANIVVGAVAGVLGKAEWDTASSATKTRNHIKLAEQLNAKEAATGRG
jgi:hypothetical protein